MRRTLPHAMRALYVVLLQQACTFYTNCPPCEQNAAQGGSGGSGGSGGTGIGGMAPSGEWVNVTSNLADMDSECGNLGFVSAKPDENLVIAGVALRGLWASVNGGESWEPYGVGDGSDEIVNRPTAMIYDPEVPERFWEVGIYNSGGIYVTNDNGETFTQVGDITHTDSVGIDFSDPDRRTMLAGRHEVTDQLHLSTDGGETWQDIGDTLPPGGKFPVWSAVLDSQTFLVGSSGFSDGNAAILRSTDGGETWEEVSELGAQFEPLLASDAAIYWSIESGGGLAKSTDDGLTWELVLGGGVGPTVRPSELSDGTLITLSSGNVIASSDGGETWRNVSPALPYLPGGVTYSEAEKAFFVWRMTCDSTVADDAIMKYEYDFDAE